VTPSPPLAALDPAFFATVLSAVVAGFSAWYVQAWRFRKEADDRALQVLRRFRDPLLRAAFDLQSRLYNIGARGFLNRYWAHGDSEEREYARMSTLWLFGQYLGWVEILRRQVQYLDLGSRSANQALQGRLNRVSGLMASDAHGRNDKFIIFRSDQRAIGEFMVIDRPNQAEQGPDCLGYSEFSGKLGELEAQAKTGSLPAPSVVVVGWAERFTRDFAGHEEPEGDSEILARVASVQRGLVDLVDLLDQDRVRYPHLNLRGRLPERDASTKVDPLEVAYFIWPWGDPWVHVEEWAGRRSMKGGQPTGPGRRFLSRRGPSGKRLEVTVSVEEGWVTVKAGTLARHRRSRIDGSLRCRRNRSIVNDLLSLFDRPLLRGQDTLPDQTLARALRRWRRLGSGSASQEV
jgi:hypothetical protein